MGRRFVSGLAGAGIASGLCGATFVPGLQASAIYPAFPGLWLMYESVGLSGVNLAWNPVLARILMTLGNAMFYGVVCYFTMSFTARWKS